MKKGSLALGFCACFLIYALLRFPSALLTASGESIQLWLTKVFPSLFPFLAACGILLRIGAAERMGVFLRPLTRLLFGLPGISAFPFFLGILSGYPMGAKITARLYEEKQITLAEAQHILTFSNNPGPLFLIGTIGAGFFGLPYFGYGLLFASFLGAVATGILWRLRRYPLFAEKSPKNRKKVSRLSARYPKKAKKVSSPSPKTLISRAFSPYPAASKQDTFTEILASSVADALHTILLIGGYLIFFAALSEAMAQTGLFSLPARLLFFLPLSAEALRGLCCGLLEMTNGAYLLSLAPDGLRLRLTFVAFLTSFGGLSILGQTLGVLSAVPIKKKDYLKGKAMNALFSSLFFYFLFPFFEQSAQKAVPAFFTFTETAFSLSLLWLLPSLFFLGVLCHAILHKR